MPNPLRSCTVDGVVANIDPAQLLFQFEVVICPELPILLSLISKLSLGNVNPYSDDVVAYYLQGLPSSEGLDDKGRLIQRNASSLLNVIAILDALSADYIAGLSLIRGTTVGDTPIPPRPGYFYLALGAEYYILVEGYEYGNTSVRSELSEWDDFHLARDMTFFDSCRDQPA
ncbi:hypothetical protein RhiJN_02252 [Ceratobasidium sp. AG-Ba]|nr:hypothetical protein RhiJN_02252 [Ceratobasidium sp. AG-Ba]QRW03190.1 hypothetical protein RhiLY_02189 [Ceratobasidium sp. AG-Ba]